MEKIVSRHKKRTYFFRICSNLKEEFDKNFELDKQINKTYVEVMEVVKETHKPTLQKFIDETGLCHCFTTKFFYKL